MGPDDYTDHRKNVRLWRNETRTVTADSAFFVGKCLAAHPKLKTYGDPCIALYVAGYKSVAAAGLQKMINRALREYPHKARVERDGLGKTNAPSVRALRYALSAIAGLPYALARVDGLTAEQIPDAECAGTLALFLGRHNTLGGKRLVDMPINEVSLSDPKFFDDKETWALDSPRQAVTDALTRGDEETLAWTALANRISLRARNDPILQLHFSMMRPLIDEYQRIVYAVPHHRPT